MIKSYLPFHEASKVIKHHHDIGIYMLNRTFWDVDKKICGDFYRENHADLRHLSFDYLNPDDFLDDSKKTFWKFWREVQYWHEIAYCIDYIYAYGYDVFMPHFHNNFTDAQNFYNEFCDNVESWEDEIEAKVKEIMHNYRLDEMQFGLPQFVGDSFKFRFNNNKWVHMPVCYDTRFAQE